MGRRQISAFVADETGELLDRVAKTHNLKKAAIIEAALLNHLRALDALPAAFEAASTILVTPAGFAHVVRQVEDVRAKGYNEAMRAFLAGEQAEGAEVLG
jgi:3-dehydroquinate dehydratase